MIALNETNEYAAEVPFTLPLATDPLTGLTGWVFTLGEVQIRLPGTIIWINVAVSKIIEKGYGRFAARLTAAQCVTEGMVYIKAIVSGTQPYFGAETIGVLGGDIPQGGSGYITFYLPDEVDPVYGTPITGADFTSFGLIRICLPNSVYQDADPTNVVNVGFGGYALLIEPPDTNYRGKVYLYAEYPGAQRFEGYATILGVGIAISTTTPPTPIEIPVASIHVASGTINYILRGIERLCEYSKSGDFEADVYVDNVGGEGFDLPLDGGLG